MESAPACLPRKRRAFASPAALFLSLLCAAPSAFAQGKAPAAAPPPPVIAPAGPAPAAPAPPPAAAPTLPPAAPPNAAGRAPAPPPAGGATTPPPPTGSQLVPPYPYPVYPYTPYPYPPYGYPYVPRPEVEPLPDEMPYEAGMQIPPGYRRTKKANRPLVIAGTVVLATGYGLSLPVGITGVIFDSEELGWLLMPVVGPFVSAATLGNRDSLVTALIIFDGITQLGGLSLLIAGLTAKEEVIERKDEVMARPAPEFFVGPGSVGMRMKF
ncbi:hypothetical protein [Polyangium aurulentum]|uniref:hypothetical protein n=1 Tax=Polyangium aurulentum TaxID=2567896 RepID=UPI0010AEE1D1|nr:hypothetical protein [Polyangium aurulentum]UQA63408.1 hypothetical protein E8A73_024230 [Polyangium aurulentum]